MQKVGASNYANLIALTLQQALAFSSASLECFLYEPFDYRHTSIENPRFHKIRFSRILRATETQSPLNHLVLISLVYRGHCVFVGAHHQLAETVVASQNHSRFPPVVQQHIL